MGVGANTDEKSSMFKGLVTREEQEVTLAAATKPTVSAVRMRTQAMTERIMTTGLNRRSLGVGGRECGMGGLGVWV